MNLLYPSIAIVDVDAGIDPAEVAKVAAALTRQALEDIAPTWGLGAAVRAVTAAAPLQPGEWQIQLRRVPTIAGALGYHNYDVLYVFPELCAQDGTNWSSCASHEMAEALADPLLCRCFQASDGKFYALEIADAVEQDVYLKDGVALSNFCLPSWGEPRPGDAKFDFMGLCKAPLEVRVGGYSQSFDATKGWVQHVNGEMSGYRKAVASIPGASRSGARSTRAVLAP